MAQVKYHIVEHNGGWAYKVGDVFSETFPTHEEAHAAAAAAAERQRSAGQTEAIQYEDAEGRWHNELALAGDRPETVVEDDQEGGEGAGGGERRSADERQDSRRA